MCKVFDNMRLTDLSAVALAAGERLKISFGRFFLLKKNAIYAP
jgi:hypothetical protein